MRSSRKRPGVAAACGLLALGGLAAAPTPARSAPGGAGDTISLDVADGNLHAVVSSLERQAHVEALVRDGDAPYKRVNVHLEDASLAKALRTIAFSAGARVSTNSDGVYVFEPDAAEAGAAPQMPAAAAGYAAGNSGQGSDAGQLAQNDDPEAHFPPGSLQWRSIVLQNAVPAEILRFMHWDRDVVNMDPFKPLQMPASQPSLSSTQANIIQSAAAQSPYSAGFPPGYPSVPIGTGNAGPAGANYAEHRSAEPESPQQANQFPGGGFPGGGFPGGGFPGGGFQGGPGGGFQGGPGGGINPFQRGPGFPGGPGGGAAAQLPTGVARMFANQSNNTLLVEATPDGFNTVRNIVRFLDVAPRQVSIKVEFVTASVTDVDALGVNFDLVPYPGLEVSTGQGSGSFGGVISGVQPTFLQYATGNIVAQLFQTLTRTRGKVVQAPLITTTNNVTATIAVNTQIPFFTTGAIANGGVAGGTTTTQQANFLTLTTGLTITPRINSNDTVTMNLNPQITDTTGQPAVGGIPPTVQQTLTTLRTVRSGDTMVLGGLVRKQESASSQRIPILSDIPFLGGLFRTRNKQVNDQELLIFVTPTIISDTNDSGAANANGGVAQTQTVTP